MAFFLRMKKTDDRLNHGLHNEAVCDYLELKKEFADWIITSAFYSALQFVTHKIFPFTLPAFQGRTTTINSINDYKVYGNKNQNKHDLLLGLVQQKHPEIYPEYNWLLDASYNARYTDYQQPPEVANKARTYLKKVKNLCLPNPPSTSTKTK